MWLLIIAIVIAIWYFSQKKESFAAPAVITLHYTNWCGYCKQMKPVWFQVKQDIPPIFVMVEQDEEKNPTPGIKGYPTIIKSINGRISQYAGGIDATELRNWIMRG